MKVTKIIGPGWVQYLDMTDLYSGADEVDLSELRNLGGFGGFSCVNHSGIYRNGPTLELLPSCEHENDKRKYGTYHHRFNHMANITSAHPQEGKVDVACIGMTISVNCNNCVAWPQKLFRWAPWVCCASHTKT